ncbi:hypothetical protein ACL6C3_18010 [Capilliphycus salinus ALCB114379]|uniref:hypothetical protein n=1 Tax=Capilliphycus salinus TaxID=2768948 RepID=UPI0039A58808
MKRLLSVICLLSLGAGPILTLWAAIPATAQTKGTELSAFCESEQFHYAFRQWTRLLSEHINPNSASAKPDNLAEILKLMKMARQSPRTTQMAIDRFTLLRNNLEEPPLLLSLIERTPASERSQLVPVVEQLITLANTLPAGYNYAQSRALIVSAIAYKQLNQPSRSKLLLQQASKTVAGIAVPSLKAETQWRLAEAWFDLGENSLGQTSLGAATATLKTLSPQSPPLNNNLPEQLVGSYLRRGQWSQAEAAARAIPTLAEESQQLFRIASAYLRAKQLKPAVALFEKTIKPLLSAPAVEQNNLAAIATEGIISFAQAGGVTTATVGANQLPTNRPALAAKAWLAIAGEARQQKRPKEAAIALERLIAAGKIGQKQGFGSDFGTLKDDQWSGSLYTLSRSGGYTAEMIQFIERLNLKTQAVEFLIVEAVQAKRYDEAMKLIPQSMPLVIDVGVFEVRDDWRWWVAAVAASQGEPQALIALSEEILPKIGRSDPTLLSVWKIPTRVNVGSPSAESPPYFVIDIRPAEFLAEDIAIRAIWHLQNQGQTELANRLSTALADQAEELLNGELGMGMFADEHPIVWVNRLEHYLRLQQQTASADRLYALQVNYLKQIEDVQQRVERIPYISSLDDPRGAIADFIELAEAVGVADETLMARRIFEEALSSGQIDIITQWQSRIGLSPRDQAEVMIRRSQMFALLEEKIVWYDKILELMQSQPEKGLLISNYDLNSMIEAYLFQGETDKVKQVIALIDDPSEAMQYQGRLDCLFSQN